MRQTPYFDLCSSVLLHGKEADMPFLIDFFKQRAELEITRKPKVYSIGGSGSDGKEQSFLDWLNAHRSGKPVNLRWFFLSETGSLCLELKDGNSSKFYIPELIRSSSYAMTGSQFYDLVNAQDNPAYILDRVIKQISEFLELNGKAAVGQAEFRQYLDSKDWEENSSVILTQILDEIQLDCAMLGSHFQIPDALKSLLMQFDSQDWSSAEGDALLNEPEEESSDPDEEESRRIKVRMQIQSKLWYPANNTNYWEFYFYRQVDLGDSDVPPRDSYPSDGDLDTFATNCENLSAFAKRIYSPFDEAFRLGAFFVKTILPEGRFDESHWEKVKEILKSQSFSGKALEIAKTTFDFGIEFSQLKLSAKAITSLFAYDITDVFGGMGSWNDGYPENAADDEEMARLNTDLQISRTRLWTDILSFVF